MFLSTAITFNTNFFPKTTRNDDFIHFIRAIFFKLIVAWGSPMQTKLTVKYWLLSNTISTG